MYRNKNPRHVLYTTENSLPPTKSVTCVIEPGCISVRSVTTPTKQKVFVHVQQRLVGICARYIQTHWKKTQGAASFRDDAVIILVVMNLSVIIQFAELLSNFGTVCYRASQRRCIRLGMMKLVTACARHIQTHFQDELIHNFIPATFCIWQNIWCFQ